MDIGPVQSVRRSDAVPQSTQGGNRAAQSQGPAPGADRVENSELALARLAELAAKALRTEPADPSSETSPIEDERLNIVRLRMLTGFYDRTEVRREIADRLAQEMNDTDRTP